MPDVFHLVWTMGEQIGVILTNSGQSFLGWKDVENSFVHGGGSKATEAFQSKAFPCSVPVYPGEKAFYMEWDDRIVDAFE